MKASALLDRQESLKKAFHMLSSIDPREGGPCQRIEDSSYRLRAEPQSAKPQASFVLPYLSRPLTDVTKINTTAACFFSDACSRD